MLKPNRIILQMIIIFFACFNNARADVLFLDFNNAAPEVAAARRAAERRGEKFYVFPGPLTTAEKEKYQRLKKESDTLYKQIYVAYESKDNATVTTLSTKLEQVDAELSQVSDKRLTAQSLKQYLDKNQSLRPSAVILSGHDGNSNYTGTFGSLNVKQFTEVMGERATDVRSVYLWGCYTSTPAEILSSWKVATPNVSVITGFEGKGPSPKWPQNMAYLEDVLVKEKRLLAEADGKKIVELVRSANSFNQMSTATCVGDVYVTPTKVQSMQEIATSCMQPVPDKIKTQIKNYQCLRHATTANCSEPPNDTGHSELREFYSYIQSHKHCIDINPDVYRELPMTDEVLNLIFYRQIVKNFERNYGDILFELNELLAESGAPAHIRLKDIAKIPRHDFLQKLNQIREFIIQRSSAMEANPPSDQALLAKLNAIEGSLFNIYNVFFPPAATKVPMSWVVGDSNEKPDKFLNKEGMGRQLERASKENTGLDPREVFIESQSRLILAQSAGRKRTLQENLQLQQFRAERGVRSSQGSITRANQLLAEHQAQLKTASNDQDKKQIQETITQLNSELKMAQDLLENSQKPVVRRLAELKKVLVDPAYKRDELIAYIVQNEEPRKTAQTLKRTDVADNSEVDPKVYVYEHAHNQYVEARYSVATKFKIGGPLPDAAVQDLATKTWAMKNVSLQQDLLVYGAIDSQQLMSVVRRQISDHDANKEKYIQEQMVLIRDVTSAYWHQELAESANPAY
jgi:hypothetical protein